MDTLILLIVLLVAITAVSVYFVRKKNKKYPDAINPGEDNSRIIGDPPSIFKFQKDESGDLLLEWVSDGKPSSDMYNIQYSTRPNKGWAELTTTGKTSFYIKDPCKTLGLENEKNSYVYFRIRTKSSDGLSAWKFLDSPVTLEC